MHMFVCASSNSGRRSTPERRPFSWVPHMALKLQTEKAPRDVERSSSRNLKAAAGECDAAYEIGISIYHDPIILGMTQAKREIGVVPSNACM